MATKTIYVRDEDVAVWDKAKDLAGESLSQLLANYLKQFVAEKEASHQGYQKILLRYLEGGELPVSKSFFGKWIIDLEHPYQTPGTGDYKDYYSLAITPKKNIVVFEWSSHAPRDGFLAWGWLDIFSSFEEAARDTEIPNKLITSAMTKIGVEVEELDI